MKISLVGYGGELVVGNLTKEQYVYWKLQDIDDLHDHVLGNVDDEDINADESLLIGTWYDKDDIDHLNGAGYSESAFVVVEDDDGKEIFNKSVIAISDLPGCDEIVKWEEGFQVEDGVHDYVFMAYDSSKGLFSELSVPGNEFDPSKLRMTVRDVEGFEILDGFWYDHPDTKDEESYDTNGKSWDCWLISTKDDDED